MAKGILKKGKMVMVLAAIGSCLCLIGCAAKEDATEAVNYASEDSSLTYAVHTELDGHAIELPQFTSTHDSAVIEELNQDIMDGPGAIYEKDKDGKRSSRRSAQRNIARISIYKWLYAMSSIRSSVAMEILQATIMTGFRIRKLRSQMHL